jgi:class 3 adenylate cyclase/streptogramin lyase
VADATTSTATFLFTDIEGSTQLLRAHRADYASILADHHRILRDAFAAHGGREIDNQGDSFFVAFTRARNAVLAAADAQRSLAAHAWPADAAVRVRMGIHTGEAEETVDRYVGLSVHRAARISALGHGGQVLVSPTTAGLLEDEDVLPGVALRDLGEHRLKDIERPVRIHQLDIDGLPTNFPPLTVAPTGPNRRRRMAVAAAGLLALVLAGVGVALASRDEPPPEIVPNSVVRLDPESFEPKDVIPVAKKPDFVVSAGGYIWITHGIIRDTPTSSDENAPELALTRVDPETGEATIVGGGLAPCALQADPSGDVWVANCFVGGSEKTPNVVRIDAETLRFETQWPLPEGNGYFRGLAYGGGSLWAGEIAGDEPPARPAMTAVDPETGTQRTFDLMNATGPLAWSEGYGDLWQADCPIGGATRMNPTTGDARSVENVLPLPCAIVVDGDVVWLGSFVSPTLARLPAVGSARPERVPLPIVDADSDVEVGVWTVAAGEGFIWATTPRDGALWRIDPKTNDVTRIPLPYVPAGVTVGSDGVWVTVRGE